jgi:hypothetical protein
LSFSIYVAGNGVVGGSARDLASSAAGASGAYVDRFLSPILAEHMENGLYDQLCRHEYDVAVTERELKTARGEANQVVEFVQGELATAQGQVTRLKEEQAKLARELREARETLTKANMDGLRKERDMLDRTLADLERFQGQAKGLEEAQEKARDTVNVHLWVTCKTLNGPLGHYVKPLGLTCPEPMFNVHPSSAHIRAALLY